ncbi:MAG: MiaB/RimO family radical SAM methylthiotransferase, partial [Oscillibacter sp.]|nr:MiaB/RimO family radical SAM methylthiotransferase [Oscillibacter sp.]
LAMLKVEDGCVNFCTYCIIPYARGRIRSLAKETAVEQTKQLAQEGYREIVLTGIEISSWGAEFKNGESLIDLIEAICQAAPQVRIRLGSLEPRTITEAFCRRAVKLPNLCPQFHLSMQSGCDATLKRMNRKYDTARYLESVNLLNQYFERPAVTTDLITGFPEETEEEFSQTLDFIRTCGFAQMHIFPYSIRPGTPAAKMTQVHKSVKEERAHRAAEVAAEMRQAYLQGCVGKTYEVLFEQPKDGKFFGHAPNYMEVLADGAHLHNVIRNVRIVGTNGDQLLGEIED